MADMAPRPWGFPVLRSTSERNTLFPNPSTEQRVHNKETGWIERFDGTEWVVDFESTASLLPGDERTVATFAGFLYNNLGVERNVLDDGASPSATAAANSVAVQKAATKAAGKKLIFPAGGTYLIDTTIELPSDIEVVIERGATVQMSTRLDSLFHADGQSGIRFSGKGKLRGTNTSYANTVTERLLFFENCDDIEVGRLDLAETIIGAQFATCTDWEFRGRVHDILHRTDNSEGYAVLANLDNDGFVVDLIGRNIGRHAIYITSGSSNGTIAGVIDGCDSVAVNVNCFDTQNTCKNIAINHLAIRNVGRSSALPNRNGITAFGNVENLSIGDAVTIDTCDDDGIHIEGNPAYAIAKNPRGISVGAPTINNAGLRGIVYINVNQGTIGLPTIRNTAASAIHVLTSGVGTGAVSDGVVVKSYNIDTCTYGVTWGEAAPGAMTNMILGRGLITNAATKKFNVTTATPPRLDMPGYIMDFSETALTSSETDNPFVANPAAAYWTAPADGYLVSLSGRVTGSISAGTLTVRASINGTGFSGLGADLEAGDTAFSVELPPGGLTVSKGAQVGVMYTTTSDFAPSGTRNAVAQVRFIESA